MPAHDRAPSRPLRILLAAVSTAAALLFAMPATAGADYELVTIAIHEPRAILPLPNGDVWVMARSKMVFRNDNRLLLYRIDRRNRPRRIDIPLPPHKLNARFASGTLAVGSDGNVWLAMGDVPRRNRTTLFRLSPTGARLATYLLPVGARATSMAAGPDGRIWLLRTADDRIGRIDADGHLTELKLKGAKKMSQLVQGFNGDMWTVARKVAVRIDSHLRQTRFTVADQDYAPESIARGPDGAMWLTALSSLQRLAPDGTLTSVPLKYPTTSDFPDAGDVDNSPKRFTVSLGLLADGSLGFTAAGFAADRLARFTYVESLGTVAANGTVDETVPGTLPFALMDDVAYGTDPMMVDSKYGSSRFFAGVDGRQWVVGDWGVTAYSLGHPFTLTPGKPALTATRSSARSVQVKLSCGGSPGKFCSGTVALRRGRSTIGRPRRYVLAAGDQLRLKLAQRHGLPAGPLKVTCTSRDVPSGVVTTVSAVVEGRGA